MSSENFIEHYVLDMDDSMVQRCVICGEVISDYSNSIWPTDSEPPRGFYEGHVYVSAHGNATVYVTQEPETFKKCKS